MPSLFETDLPSDSGSEAESQSDSGSSRSGSDSKSEAGSVRSRQSAASKSASSSRSAQSPAQAHSRSGSASSRSSSDNNGEGNLVLDERRSQSRSPSRSRSQSSSSSASAASAASAASHHSDEEKEKEGKDTAQSSPAQETTKKRSKRIIDSDADSASGSDAEEKRSKTGATSPTAEALFGENLDISSEDGDDDDDDDAKATQKLPEKHDSDADKDSDADRRHDDMDQDDEFGGRDQAKEKEPEEVVPETKIEHEIPYIRADVGKEFHFVKLPNFLSVEPRPYDPETYEDELEEEETLDEEGRARLKLKVENTIRWRTAFDKEGNAFKESNARMVKWSDGSLSLHLGSEIFDVYRQPLQGDHNHLFIRQGTGLQGQAVFRTKLTFRPHSTDSFTHRKMTKSLAERSTKTSAIKIIGAVGEDPEANRGEKIKKEEERLRASVRRESKQKRIRERTAIGRGMSGSYLEPDREGYDDSEDEGGISLTAIKNKYKRGGDVRPPIYSSEEDASDIEDRKAKKLDRAKALRDSDEDDDDGEAGTSGTGKVRVVSSSSEESD